jgi:anti-sigma factor RsiW
MCDKSERILEYVYNELPESARREFEAHLHACADCREEVAGLRATRGVLAAWTPPEPDFGFRVIREQQTPPRQAARRFAFAPAWGLAAAAVLVLAAAAAIANVEVRYDAAGLVVRTGWGSAGAAAQASPQAAPVQAAATADASVYVAALEKRVSELETMAASRVQTAAGPRVADADWQRQVQQLIAESEKRQQRDTVTRINDVVDAVDRARQLDMKLLQAGLTGQLRGVTAAEVSQQLNYMLTRASQQK